jgi:hypothetical protein
MVVWCNAYSEMSGKAPVYYYNSAVIKDSTNSTFQPRLTSVVQYIITRVKNIILKNAFSGMKPDVYTQAPD